MGLSFENLLKGILIAQGTPATKAGRLKKEFLTHDLCKLIVKVEKPPLVFSAGERDLLSEIGRFVVWQGRYPIPLGGPGYSGMFIFNDPDQHLMERELWNRLRDYLATIGWQKDGEGKRYKLNSTARVPF